MIMNGLASTFVASFMSRARRFAADAGGNFAILTGLMLVPLVGMGGLALDHWKASTAKSDLENAADAAALAAINRAAAVLQLPTKDANAAIAAGIDAGRSQFKASAGKTPDTSVSEPEVTLTINGLLISAQVKWGAATKANFSGVFGGGGAINMVGDSQSSVTMPGYVKIFVVVDNSASMGIAASEEGQVKLYNLIHCAIACHLDAGPQTKFYDVSGGVTSYTYARNLGIDTRIDVIRAGVTQILDKAKTIRVKSDQFSIGLYTFSADPVELIAPTPNLDAVRTAAAGMELTRKGGSTDVKTMMNYIANKISSGSRGDGSSFNKPMVYVLFATDGLSSNTLYDPPTNTWPRDTDIMAYAPSYLNNFSGLDPYLCAPVKNISGVTLLPLNIDYIVPKPDIRGDHDTHRFAFIENYILPLQDQRFRQCASNGAYFKARTSQEILSSLQSMFEQTIPRPPRLLR